MTESTRRSSRRREKITYAEGDLVEVARNATLTTGRLVSQVIETAGAAKPPRWLVTFDDQPTWPDAEILESELGPMSDKADEQVAPKKGKKTTRRSSEDLDSGSAGRNSNAANNAKGSPSGSGKSSSGENSPVSGESIGSLTKEEDALADDGALDSSNSSKKTMSREERSKRRQAMIDEDKLPGFKQIRPIKKKKLKNGEDVVRVPLLTGTLYLYRGLHRRAEFVSKV